MNQAIISPICKISSVRASRHGVRRGKHRPNPCIRLIMLLVCACGLTGGGAALADTVFSDTEFDVANDWSDFGPFVIPADAMNAALDTQQVPTGGNPGAHMELTLTRATVNDGSTGTWAAVINDKLVWNPAHDADGPIDEIDFRLDIEGGGAWTLAVKQGEHVWLALARRILPNTLDPVIASIEKLGEADFVALPGSEFVIQDQPLHPDFSADGAPISLGIGTGLSCPSTSDCTQIRPATFKLDNFVVTVRVPFVINDAISDAWFFPDTSGQGFFIIIWEDSKLVFLSWFTYDTELPPQSVTAFFGAPGQRWVTALGPFEGDTALLDVFLSSGMIFDSAEPPVTTEQMEGATIEIVWTGCNAGILKYNIPSLGLSGEIPIERIVLDNVPACEAAQSPE